ncbi:hypothetical protein RG836_03605 [Pseudomonas sp. SZMC_28357]|uniref:DUF6896 domain-containing protein n=1 Tax=Pseudomonas sp. SZMC_28357 TaxID=3074380 RepID=UPI002871E739|nr:hypothetical protein [Pseudomonas sp. SZMC_28357]MDR9750519.1 hypothetical protein [Pseudomonas sp. SZMC_28357]
MNDDLSILINDFLSEVERAAEALEKKFGSRCVLGLWRGNQIERCGILDDTTTYELHGVGCLVSFSNISIDFDYGPGGRTDCFDIWRLYNFAMDQPERYRKYTNKRNLEADFVQYISLNIIQKVSADATLYSLKNT